MTRSSLGLPAPVRDEMVEMRSDPKRSSTDHLEHLLQHPGPPDHAKDTPSLAVKFSFIVGQIFLGTLHVILVHSSSHSSSHTAEDKKTVGLLISQAADTHRSSDTHKYRYSAVLVILLAEILKLVLSIIAFSWFATRNPENALAAKTQVVAALTPRRFLRFSLPAVVYTIENHIRFAVLKELASPVTWVVFSHLEIPIVALMTVFILGRRLSIPQWISVILLVDGVMASQMAICESRLGVKCDHLSDFPITALFMVLLSALMAATAGTAVEYLFKEEYGTSLHLQNSQLYVWGIVSNAVVLVVQERKAMEVGTLWDGFDKQVIFILITMALQGLCVAAVVKHMSNVAKVYASACGLFVAALMSAIMSDFDFSLPFSLAAIVVCCALYLYHMDGHRDMAGTGTVAGVTVSIGKGSPSTPQQPSSPLHALSHQKIAAARREAELRSKAMDVVRP
mmetsp:Transcript_23226/g.38833  ORF Transcript_23226/g.38833 Transcript_23226/m.38833 type:complete len:452 (-) Transcript_23226:223-1578(-)|eukprot:CAMPEP_0198200026 /NCGR_PEP_ID=MMETSP1445-20131203/3107_1 /TAXON_ID=36898 /ORGANISM="Pyramimonas sp., Strain CCMP2087" /LENGTH=451 /DNA_ID=CAMNT_0043869963 /DNA_START=315 /DNA_END=1673 /DNA_ORIENTATION=-